MLSIGAATRIFLAVQPVDLRASFNRLHGLIQEVLRVCPKSLMACEKDGSREFRGIVSVT